MNIKIGDKCRVDGWKNHYSVCVGHDWYGQPVFVHNTPAGGVERTDLAGFAAGRLIHIEQHAAPGDEDAVVARAISLIGQQYNLLLFNCEHVATYALTGRAESGQVQVGAVVTGLAMIFLAVLNNNGTAVDSSGYRRNASGQFAARRWV